MLYHYVNDARNVLYAIVMLLLTFQRQCYRQKYVQCMFARKAKVAAIGLANQLI